jgi:hypothetical protein
MSEVTVTGGCQCGAVRYAMHMAPAQSHYCHCRMCQRATGNLFAALAGATKDKLEWTRGAPTFFASSSLARRGFCAACGTPLTFAYDESKWIYVTIGSLDDPSCAHPEKHYGIESQVHWLKIEDALPREPTKPDERLARMTIHQFGGGASHG